MVTNKLSNLPKPYFSYGFLKKHIFQYFLSESGTSETYLAFDCPDANGQ
jgi:hypothetical protein